MTARLANEKIPSPWLQKVAQGCARDQARPENTFLGVGEFSLHSSLASLQLLEVLDDPVSSSCLCSSLLQTKFIGEPPHGQSQDAGRAALANCSTASFQPGREHRPRGAV